MLVQDLEKQIFEINSGADFEKTALALFHHQAEHNAVYKQYLKLLRVHHKDVNSCASIPFMPIRFFKDFEVISGQFEPEVAFTSSGTTGAASSKHFVKSTELYIQSFLKCFRTFYGNEKNYTFVCLLPSYMERQGSSLIYMMNYLVQQGQQEGSGFYPRVDDAFVSLMTKLQQKDKHQVFLLGVTFALLELAEKYPVDLSQCIIMETGGMKGRRKEITRPELYEVLQKNLHVTHIHSEYGMTELLSQAYAKEKGLFFCPPHMRVFIRDMNDPFTLLEKNKTGVINVIDLANIHSCAFIATDDAGKLLENGGFEVLGRIDNSDIRGCNLLMS
ncbi:MAG: acyl transferase [Bacteroidota bacterium]